MYHTNERHYPIDCDDCCVQIVLIDLMGGKACDTPINAMALPARPKNWIVILASHKPAISGPAGVCKPLYWCFPLVTACVVTALFLCVVTACKVPMRTLHDHFSPVC